MSITESTPKPAEQVDAKLPNGHVEESPEQPVQVNGHADLKTQDGVNGDGDPSMAVPGLASLTISNDGPLSGSSPSPESELHAACAAGQIDTVRSILSLSLDKLEKLDVVTGCTPIVLAIRNNHHEVVRELLNAGAIVPPPGVTNDGYMMGILYPMGTMYGHQGGMQGMNGMYGQPMGQEFYGYYPQDGFRRSPNGQAGPHGQTQGQGMMSPGGNGNVNGAGNLPPADVAKTIPCRNYPNCKYGSNCVFFHPGGPGGPVGRPGPAYPQQGQQFANGFDGQSGFNGVLRYGQPEFQRFQGQAQPGAVEQDQAQPGEPSRSPMQRSPADTLPNGDAHPATLATPNGLPQAIPNGHLHPQGVPNGSHPAAPAIFIPGGLSPPQTNQFGMSLSPISPSMLAGSLPSIPPADQFFAAGSPPSTTFQSLAAASYGQPQPFHIPNGGPIPGHGRRQSFGQPFGAKPFGHGKKLSFSGGPRPFRGPGGPGGPGERGNMGSWKDGNPPPCAFFAQGKCRNGELCKFPHLDEQGNDCRHPDVIRGIIPPLPPLNRQRGMRSSAPWNYNMPTDPSMRQPHPNFMQQPPFPPFQPSHQSHHSRASLPGGMSLLPENTLAIPTPSHGGDSSSTSASADGIITNDASNLTSNLTTPDPSLDASVTDKNSLPTKPSPSVSSIAAAMPSITRSASQPGVQRVNVSVSGFNSRAHSPAPSNVSFHGNGHPRRGGGNVRGGAFGGAGRSASGDRKIPPAQRVPRAEEFPALGGPGGSKSVPGSAVIGGSPSVDNGGWGKTAAQVLSMPAPPKPEKKQEVSEEANVTMEDDEETGAVIVSHGPTSTSAPTGEAKAKSSPSNTEPTTVSSPTKRPSVSFASVIASPQVDPAPVGVKA